MVLVLQIKVHLEFVDMKQALEMEHDLCDRLEEQISDMTELHQHEISELKQVMTPSIFSFYLILK